MKRYGLPLLLSLFAILAAVLPGFDNPQIELDRYSPEVAVLTITAIAVIWYTYLTYQSVEQVRSAQAESEARTARRLYQVVKHLFRTVGDLPEKPDHPSLRQATRWSEALELELMGLAASRITDIRIIGDAERAVGELAWLRGHLEAIQVKDGKHSQEAWQRLRNVSLDWTAKRQFALNHLALLLEHVSGIKAFKSSAGQKATARD